MAIPDKLTIAGQQAANYRARAEELRVLSEGMGHRESAEILRRLADQNDALAERLEQRAAKSKRLN